MNTTTTEGIREGECQKWDSVMHECAQDILHGVYIIIIQVCIRVKQDQRGRTKSLSKENIKERTTLISLIEEALETSGKLRS